jgi:hypothetical protein
MSSRESPVVIRRHLCPVIRSARQMRSSASQQTTTCARIRCSRSMEDLAQFERRRRDAAERSGAGEESRCLPSQGSSASTLQLLITTPEEFSRTRQGEESV